MNEEASKIKFKVNGKEVIVGDDVNPTMRLSSFLRDKLHLTGTKISCGQV